MHEVDSGSPLPGLRSVPNSEHIIPNTKFKPMTLNPKP